MPEGDTIHHAARQMRAALVGQPIEAIEAPQPRHRHDRLGERLSGRSVRAVEAHGKHLFVRFEGGLTLHSHLRMSGSWAVYRLGRRWRRGRGRAWLVIRTDTHEVVQFDGPVLDLMTDGRARLDRRLAALGPDVLADDFDEGAFLRCLRADDPARTIGDALLDQRNVAGIGNAWKSEACHLAGVDPWRPLAALADEEACAIVRAARPPMRLSAEGGGRGETGRVWHGKRASRARRPVYRRAGLPCGRCGALIRARGQGEHNRRTYWCPGCQR